MIQKKVTENAAPNPELPVGKVVPTTKLHCTLIFKQVFAPNRRYSGTEIRVFLLLTMRQKNKMNAMRGFIHLSL